MEKKNKAGLEFCITKIIKIQLKGKESNTVVDFLNFTKKKGIDLAFKGEKRFGDNYQGDYRLKDEKKLKKWLKKHGREKKKIKSF